ncbi:NADH-quinone oxidoreductase subunit N [Adhaeribacter sp. BT258]|uniref:NADH-quinone oxidoreductase subunit N n=1 Tax=Adhaeribacter terrigena TaxID=2793070 RepID=A0ABS1C5M5_9BACT|nr:NADH-quinone oxidoreductase subunit N [Adhaeribacter terrigena]MBK0404603.1 NADH-quinone oxidoreductase subunit N [Adhaeribacter terrigena]
MRFPPEITRSLLPKLEQIQASLDVLAPEGLLVALFLLLLLLGLFRSNSILKMLPGFTVSGLSGIIIFQFFMIENSPGYFGKMLVADGLANYGFLLFSAAGILTVLLSELYPPLKVRSGRSEYYAFIVLLVLGLSFMAKATNLLFLFLAIETVSIASYFLTLRLREEKPAAEATLKYLLFGAVAAGIMLYGMSFLYGFTQSLQFTELSFWQKLSLVPKPILTMALALTLGGFLFKLAAFPFQFWAPDVYQGAPTPVVAFFSTAPKAAILIVLIRFVSVLDNETLAPHFQNLFLILAALSFLTMLAGNFTALWQTNVKRLLAYSSVAHAGLLLAVVLLPAETRNATILFYVTILLFSNCGLFLIIQIAEEMTGSNAVAALSGLGRIFPFLGVATTILVISLTGLPPTAGFTAKLLLFTGLWENYAVTKQIWYLVLLLAGLVFTAVALFYYIKLPFFLFFRKTEVAPARKFGLAPKLLVTLLLLPVVYFFFRADALLSFIQGFTNGN